MSNSIHVEGFSSEQDITEKTDMPENKFELTEVKTKIKTIDEEIKTLEIKIEQDIEKFRDIRKNRCLPFFIDEIEFQIVNDTFDTLKEKYKDCDGRLDIILDSSGGDLDAAYNLSTLFRKYGHKELNFFVPRWAKSAATLLAVSGDNLYMSPIAELGPLDPQISQFNSLERRLEKFSPLDLESTLEMIRKEFDTGNKALANGLMQRLQFPLTLGNIIKSIEASQCYMCKLISTRLLKDYSPDKIKIIAEKFTKGYPDHGYCINLNELDEIGINVVKEIKDTELDIIWDIYKANAKKQNLQEEKSFIESNKNSNTIKNLDLPGNINKGRKHITEWGIL